jgi:hypothetical protein
MKILEMYDNKELSTLADVLEDIRPHLPNETFNVLRVRGPQVLLHVLGTQFYVWTDDTELHQNPVFLKTD